MFWKKTTAQIQIYMCVCVRTHTQRYTPGKLSRNELDLNLLFYRADVFKDRLQ